MAKQRLITSFDDSVLPEFCRTESLIAGVDEVGRGALFGPVVAASVLIPRFALNQLVEMGIRDSKQLSPKRRTEFAAQIKELATDYQISFATVQEIDQINILQASLLAMKRAVIKLKVQPDICLVDGRQAIPELPLQQKNLIKGDERSPVIAAASILAKVWRDALIMRISPKYPAYDLAANKGYGTAKHREALQKYGPSALHRLSFRPCQPH